MVPDENPYPSPDLPAASGEPEPNMALPPRELVARGRLVFLAIATAALGPEIVVLCVPGATPSVIRLVLTFGIVVAMWYGYDWAVILMAIGFVLGVILTLVAGLAGLQEGSAIVIVISLAIAAVYAGVLVTMFRSESFNAFLKYQKQKRLQMPR